MSTQEKLSSSPLQIYIESTVSYNDFIVTSKIPQPPLPISMPPNSKSIYSLIIPDGETLMRFGSSLAKKPELLDYYYPYFIEYFSKFKESELEAIFDNWGIPTRGLDDSEDYAEKYLDYISTLFPLGVLPISLDPSVRKEAALYTHF